MLSLPLHAAYVLLYAEVLCILNVDFDFNSELPQKTRFLYLMFQISMLIR